MSKSYFKQFLAIVFFLLFFVMPASAQEFKLPSSDSITATKSLDYQKMFQSMISNVRSFGEKNYDLSLGRVALAASKPDEALMACERVLINDSNNVDARLCLSRAYYKLGAYDQAKEELQPLLSRKKQSAEVSALSKQISNAISARDKSYRWYGKLDLGYDNNVAATADEDYVTFINLMGFDFTPDPSLPTLIYDLQVALRDYLYNTLGGYNEKLKSAYVQPRLGIKGSHVKPGSKYALFWDLNGAYKNYVDVSKYDITQGNVVLGGSYSPFPSYILNCTLYCQEYLLQGKRYRETPMTSLSVSKQLNSSHVLKIYTEDGALIYPGIRKLSVYMYSGGLEWRYMRNRNTVITQTFYGRNQPRGGGVQDNKYNGSNYLGAGLTFKRKIDGRTSFTVGGVYQNALYDEKEFSDSPRRRDEYSQLSVGLYRKLSSSFTWYVNASYLNNRSNLQPYKFDRFEALTGISFEV